jgi:hypothetical protein
LTNGDVRPAFQGGQHPTFDGPASDPAQQDILPAGFLHSQEAPTTLEPTHHTELSDVVDGALPKSWFLKGSPYDKACNVFCIDIVNTILVLDNKLLYVEAILPSVMTEDVRLTIYTCSNEELVSQLFPTACLPVAPGLELEDAQYGAITTAFGRSVSFGMEGSSTRRSEQSSATTRCVSIAVLERHFKITIYLANAYFCMNIVSALF